jgi:hypothetical protein
LCRSRISRATRASVFGGRFSLNPLLELREYDWYEPEDIAIQRTRDQRESSSQKAMGVTLETDLFKKLWNSAACVGPSLVSLWWSTK